MQIAIVGAGLTGLTTAYQLSKNHQVTVFEKEKYPGGLTAGFKKKNWNWHLEYFFHHLFTSDRAAKNLIAELDLRHKLFYSRPKTSIYHQGKICRFDSPASLLAFPHLSPADKLRAGLVTGYLKLTNDWKKFERVTAYNWLKKYYGSKTYQVLWQPLLQAKFGKEYQKVAMSWFWARIKKRSAGLGYIKGGFQILIDKLMEEIRENKGEILLGHEVNNLTKIQRKFDRVIITTPISTFLKITPALPKTYCQKLKPLKMIGALNLVFVLKEKFLPDNTYWLNINELGFPFVAVVEHTNFINSKHYNGSHILYTGGYYPQNHRYFQMTKEQILEEFLPYLQKINPKFNRLSATRLPARQVTYHLSCNLFAQPVVTTGYSQLIPSCYTPFPNVFLANMQMIYPWDRGVNYAIDLGQKIARLAIENK